MSARFAWLTLIGSAMLGLVACGSIDRLTGDGQLRRVRDVGTAASAVVVDIWDTGITINDDPVVGFHLTVSSGEAVYAAETRARISRLDIPRIQPGATLPVRIDPSDRSMVVVDLYSDR